MSAWSGHDPDLLSVRRAELALVTGEPTVARRLVADTLERLIEPDLDTDARRLMIIGLRAEADEADAARGSDDRDREAAAIARARMLEEQMRRRVARIAEVVSRMAPPIEADWRLAQALASRARGEASVDVWEAAVAARRSLGRPFELAHALANLAATSFRARRRRRARRSSAA